MKLIRADMPPAHGLGNSLQRPRPPWPDRAPPRARTRHRRPAVARRDPDSQRPGSDWSS